MNPKYVEAFFFTAKKRCKLKLWGFFLPINFKIFFIANTHSAGKSTGKYALIWFWLEL